ncbi:MAG: arsenite efflux transporter metallochaperone ArsD [Bryobacteraceae bacterium]|jgi:hypothetical protein
MLRIEVFDPPMCCSTGVCGPTVDPALAQFAADLHWLANQRIAVERYNLAQQPQAFAANEVVRIALKEHGNECLPLILLDGLIVSIGCYPNRHELARLAGVEPDQSSELTPEPVKDDARLTVIKTRCC